jgi:hypothetical protein
MGAVLRRGLTADDGLGEYRSYGTPGGEGTITLGGCQLHVEVPSGR